MREWNKRFFKEQVELWSLLNHNQPRKGAHRTILEPYQNPEYEALKSQKEIYKFNKQAHLFSFLPRMNVHIQWHYQCVQKLVQNILQDTHRAIGIIASVIQDDSPKFPWPIAHNAWKRESFNMNTSHYNIV